MHPVFTLPDPVEVTHIGADTESGSWKTYLLAETPHLEDLANH